MKKSIAFAVFALLFFGCAGIGTTPIEELNDNPQKYVGEKVTVSGTVDNTVKLGSLSGYTLTDDEGNSLRVSSGSLPKEGKSVTVSGVFTKDSLFGYYLQVS
ncbi:hypothetical protein GF412_05235 [Candidatus Micrarchaeota archaeon]|nr:hypothetical protein [Candidatus Micrarchaeota archaeon]MBD3418357.1 hypothetical protein [Candidatus Micrarchaeota archaeon]